MSTLESRPTSAAPGEVRLRDVADSDLPLFFEQQRDPGANQMAAFTREDPDDRASFDAHWCKIRADRSVTLRTVLLDGAAAGYLVRFNRTGEPEVGFWIGRAYWGRGVATRALSAFLEEPQPRPLTARAAKDNAGSLRVLQKCGFVICGEDEAYSNARDCDVEEYVLRWRPRPEGA